MEIFDFGPKVKNGTRILFVSGDERRAKELVIDFIESLGFKTIDLSIRDGGKRDSIRIAYRLNGTVVFAR
jgi:predicted dinucleotide-binding enzyme